MAARSLTDAEFTPTQAEAITNALRPGLQRPTRYLTGIRPPSA